MDPKKLAALVGKQLPPPERATASRKDRKIANKIGDKVQSGDVDDTIMDLMYDFDPKYSVPPWVTSEKTWKRAKDAVDPEGEGATKYDNAYVVTAHVYQTFGGGIVK